VAETTVPASTLAESEETAAPASTVARPERSEPQPVPDPSGAPYGEGSAQPLDSGDAPTGYAVKGNSASMKYHTPEGQWYEQTDADVWFDSAEHAEAAGFVEAGSPASIEANEAADEEGEK
jgi:large subunit ribosomal protein L4